MGLGAVGAMAALGIGACLVPACESSDPESTPLTTITTTSTGGGGQGGGLVQCATDENVTQLDNSSCQALASDYVPGSGTDGWASCVSDDNAYHPFDANISSIVRVGAFEQIAALLGFGQDSAPDAQGFLDARVAYSADEGLESRVSRREDEHYAAAPKACNEMTSAELAQYAERCVGPAQIQPLLNDAFAEGIAGVDPALNAARIEAGLIWFLYASTFKEATTCAKTAKDCDSSYAYYSGGEPRSGGLGLSRYARARSLQAHDRVWDGILGVRCWRDLDNPTGEAQNVALRDQARAQLDRALLRTVALIVRQRAQMLPCDAAWETVRILGPVLGREASERDPTNAALLRAEVTRATQDEVNVTALVAALDAIFPCP
jgi:hypothetical protein